MTGAAACLCSRQTDLENLLDTLLAKDELQVLSVKVLGLAARVAGQCAGGGSAVNEVAEASGCWAGACAAFQKAMCDLMEA